MDKPLMICTRCVMDTSAQEISFDQSGQCNFCTDFVRDFGTETASDKVRGREEFFAKIKHSGRGNKYDCIIGLSGGVDSSYTLLLAKEHGLRPLAVHLDNGWNSELAVSNIEKLTRTLKVELYTHVIDWQETKALQRSFIQADVIDIEMIMDNAMLALNYQMASKHGLKFILAGTNTATEGLRIPTQWNHYKFDAKNIRAINRAFSNVKIRTQPLLGTMGHAYYRYVRGIEWISFLDYFDYVKEDAICTLKDAVDYQPYPYKHYESIFTRFYQGYILPHKFGVDKRKVHLSNLICTQQMSRDEALKKLSEDPYPDAVQKKDDLAFVLKKLEISQQDWAAYLARPMIPHDRYPSELPLLMRLKHLKNSLRQMSRNQEKL